MVSNTINVGLHIVMLLLQDLAIDAAGYHSQSRGRSEQSRAGNEPGSTSQTPSSLFLLASTPCSDVNIAPGPPSSTSRVRRSTPQGRRKHNLKLSPSVSAPLPVLRATSEPPPDTEVELDPRPSSHLGVSDIPVQEYSWEWGEFPQPSPFTPTFGNGRGAAWSTIGKARGKARLSVLSGGENRMDDGVQTRGRSELDVGGLETIRSHSVPPGLEGSPVTKRRELAKRGHHDPDDVLDHGQRGIRRGSLASASPPRVRRDASPGYGIGGKLTASRGDPTRFAVLIEGRAVTFELCVLEKPDEDDVFDGRDELETARVFDAGKVDFRRFLEDPSIVTTKRLVIRWSGDR
jgi:phosphatidate phosphatase LPIN